MECVKMSLYNFVTGSGFPQVRYHRCRKVPTTQNCGLLTLAQPKCVCCWCSAFQKEFYRQVKPTRKCLELALFLAHMNSQISSRTSYDIFLVVGKPFPTDVKIFL